MINKCIKNTYINEQCKISKNDNEKNKLKSRENKEKWRENKIEKQMKNKNTNAKKWLHETKLINFVF